MALSAIHIIEQQANAYFDNFANTLDDLQRLYEETGDVQALECRNRLLARYQSKPFKGDPASKNNGKSEGGVSMRGAPESKPDLNYFAPKKNLQEMLNKEWFDKVCTDKNRYACAWREFFVADLMKSEHGEYIARKWADKSQILMIRGHVVGALKAAGVLKGSDLALARAYLDKDKKDLSPEVKTFGKYIGESRRAPYIDWVADYVAQQP